MNKQYLEINPEVKEALENGKPVVSLESTIISHGMPYPQNLEMAKNVEKIVRDNGAVPATIAIMDGKLKVGLSESEVEDLAKLDAVKVSRRDIPFIVANKKIGATTVASAMIISEMAGIKVFATGGIGGVHRDAENTFDISADLDELGKTNVAVVCAGIKSILDLGLTLEYLETKGVPVIGFNTDKLPAFYCQESEFDVDYNMSSAEEISNALKIKWDSGVDGGVVVANPIPDDESIPSSEIDKYIEQAIEECEEKGVGGKESTPFLLSRVCDLTEGKSLIANIALVYNNAKLAAQVASHYHKK